MICESYTIPRLAAVYDQSNPLGEEMLFYLRLAGHEPISVLELGCGTGRLACELAERGHRVTGADPARAMLDIARRRPGGDRVNWIYTDAASMSADQSFDLAIMTGHVFQVFLSDEEAGAALKTACRHLRPNGRIAFETRNPAVEEWKGWTLELTHEKLEIESVGRVEVHYELGPVEGQLVNFSTHYQFSDERIVTVNTLRFMPQSELAAILKASGFVSCEWFGDFNGRPLSGDVPEIIAVAGK